MSIEEIRAKLNALDAQLLETLAKRMAIVPEVAGWKAKNNSPITHPKREEEVLKSAEKMAEDLGLNPKLAREIFKAIIKDSKRIQEEIIAQK